MTKTIQSLLKERSWFIKLIYSLIIINVLALIIESYESISTRYNLIFQIIEIISVVIFTIEYIFRLYHNSTKSSLKFIFSPLGLIDLIAILPFYLPMLFPFDLRMVRILRLFRLLRIFKLGRYSKSMKLINKVLRDTKSDLLTTCFVAFILLILSSTLMYYVEGDAQPDKFVSIGHSFWWSVATLTTVGYGDIYPITALGKIISSIIAIIGIGFVALPTGIISSAFIENIKDLPSRKCICPNCGTSIET